MSNITDKWKTLKPAIGSLIGEINNLYGQASSIEEVRERQYQKGYKAGYGQGANDIKQKEICADCQAKEFYNKYISCPMHILEMLRKLNRRQQNVVVDLLCELTDYKEDDGK